MSFARSLLATCASAAITFAAPIAAGAVTTTSSTSASPACTTKDAHAPNQNQRPQLTGKEWWQTSAQSPFTMAPSHGQTPNDMQSLNRFPTVFVQPTDDAAGSARTPALHVSTCSTSGI